MSTPSEILPNKAHGNENDRGTPPLARPPSRLGSQRGSLLPATSHFVVPPTVPNCIQGRQQAESRPASTWGQKPTVMIMNDAYERPSTRAATSYAELTNHEGPNHQPRTANMTSLIENPRPMTSMHGNAGHHSLTRPQPSSTLLGRPISARDAPSNNAAVPIHPSLSRPGTPAYAAHSATMPLMASADFTIKAAGRVPRSNSGPLPASERASTEPAAVAAWVSASKSFVMSRQSSSGHGQALLRSSSGSGKLLAPKASLPRLAANIDARRFLLGPGPMNEPVKCRVTRVKTGLLGSSVQYIMTLQEDDVAILIARRHHRANGAATLHIHACDVPGGSIDGRRPVAKLHANFMGTEYSMVTEAEDHANSTHECKTDLELGAVAFAPNVMGTKGPRRITAVVPKLVPAGDTAWELVPAAAPAGSLMARHRATAAGMNPAGGCVALRNRPPRWNDALGAYCLNFRGRVTQASVKNFQLIAEDDPDRVIVQFGRVGANTFTLDYAFPIGPLQAFATALAALDPKLGCE